MEDNFDFDKVGKRMPYKVPSDFFDKITESTLAEAERRSIVQKKPRLFLSRAVSVAASLSLLLTIGYFVYFGRSKQDTTIAVTEQGTTQSIPANKLEQANSEIPSGAEPSTIPQDNPAMATAPNAAGKADNSQAQQIAKADKPETLDEILASISDEELLLLAAVAETDLEVHEQTITNEQTF